MADWVAIVGAATGPPGLALAAWRFKLSRPRAVVELSTVRDSPTNHYFRVSVANNGGQTLHLNEVVVRSTRAPAVELPLSTKKRLWPWQLDGLEPTKNFVFVGETPGLSGRLMQAAPETFDRIDAAQARALDLTAAARPSFAIPVVAVARTGDRREWTSNEVWLVDPRADV